MKSTVEIFDKVNRPLIANHLQKTPVKPRVYTVLNPLSGDTITGSLQKISDDTGLTKSKLRKIIKNNELIPNFNSPILRFKNMKQSKEFTDTIKLNIENKIEYEPKGNNLSLEDFIPFEPNPLALQLGEYLEYKPPTIETDELNEFTEETKGKFVAEGDMWKSTKFNTINQTFTYEGDYDDIDILFDNVGDLSDNLVNDLNLQPQDKVRFVYIGGNGQVLSSSKYSTVDNIDDILPSMETTVAVISNSWGVSYEEIIDDYGGIGEIQVFVARNPTNNGRGIQVNEKSKIYTKKSIIRIKNKDDLCLGRAIVCAIAKKDNHPKYRQIIMGRKIQDELTNKLYEDAKVEKSLGNLNKIKQFEKYLDCCITVIDADSFNNVVYPDTSSSDYELKDFNIYLYSHNNHYDLIACDKIAGFFGTNYFCQNCKKTYSDKNKHKCKFKCNICACSDCDSNIKIKDNNWLPCGCCNRYFPSEKCFENHKKPDKNGLSMCNKIFKCQTCKKIFDKKVFCMETHKCGDTYCKNCKCVVGANHRCFMMPTPIKTPSENYIFFDFEARQETGTHIVNYCIAEYFDDPEPIEFFDRDTFCEWLFDTNKHKDYTVIAHNGKGYDYQFILKWIYNKTTYKPSIVYAGSKIMTMKIKQGLNLRFIDSLNFLTMPLEKFPKTFGLQELKKGYFPHFFNTKENEDYVGPMPGLEYFKPDTFKDDKRKKFLEWYQEKIDSNYEWNMKKEMREYCISDVDILRRCCMKFREIYLDIADIDPFKYTTIASVCMAIFKGHYIVDGFNDDYYDLEGDKDSIELYNEKIRNQVFEEKKIAILTYEEQQFIRKSFFGGRTNATKLKYNFKDGEEGRYADITSLYPTVNYYDKYPKGEPKTILNVDDTIRDRLFNKEFVGFVDCYVIPPKNLYFPVLAEKGEKLLFNLENKRGVWSTIELYKAIDMGYKVKDIYKIMYFDETIDDLFKPYVSKFLKIKQEASGYPDWVETDEDKDKYILQYKTEQGIQLEKNKIEYNPGLRAIAKLCLNSLWGKFGMRLNMTKTEIIDNPAKYTSIMFDDEKYKDQDFYFIGDDKNDDSRIEMRYKLQDKYIDLDYNTNLAIASFTTSHARLRLYEGLEKLNRQVLYHDTDSIVYVYNKNNRLHKELELGDNLGEWTDELEGGKMKGTFASGGPKNYSYEKHKNGKVSFETKIKGFNLTYDLVNDVYDDDGNKIRDGLNHQSVINVVNNRNEEGNNIKIDYSQITRNKNKALTTVDATKTYQFCYDKRHICEPDKYGNIDTLPFGHKLIK